MKKTKLLGVLLTLSLLMCGCFDAPAAEIETLPTTSGNSAFVMPDIPEVMPDTVSLLAEGFYCAGENCEITFYPFSIGPYFFVDLFSTEPLPKDATVRLNTDVPHSAEIVEVIPQGAAETQYPYVLYLCTQETDWPQFAQAYARAQYAAYEKETYRKQGIAPTQEQQDRWEMDTATYIRVLEAHKQGYEQQLAQWEIAGEPIVYQYRMGFNLSGRNKAVDETITEAILTYGGKIATIPVGRVQLKGTESRPYPVGSGLYAQTMAIGDYPGGTPWGTGMLDISTDIIFVATENVKIKDLYFYNNDAKIQQCVAELTSGNMSMNQLWTPGEDIIDLREGDSVSFCITIQDEDLQKREYAKNLALICEYEQDGETYCENMDLQVIRRRIPYEVYLWAFEQADTQSYYQQFYNVVTNLAFMEG